MKVVLSRKGFDSANGGIASPIFEDGTMVSFPIPSEDEDTYDDFIHNGFSYAKILKDLHYHGSIYCHADPDLDQSRRKKQIENWAAGFGQINSSAMYLKNIGVQRGDLFLFFGNFHRVKNVVGKFEYTKKTGDFYQDKNLQVIWGYLQVSEILNSAESQGELWWHPHANESRIKNSTK